MSDDLPDDDILEPAQTLPPLVTPDGHDYMPLFCAAQWIATEGGRRTFDPVDTEIWRPAFRKLLGAIASKKVSVEGVAKQKRKAVPSHLFAGIQVVYPYATPTPIDLILSDELVLWSSPYLGDEDWKKSSGDALADRTRDHWRRLTVLHEDVRLLWPFDQQTPEATEDIGAATNGEEALPGGHGTKSKRGRPIGATTYSWPAYDNEVARILDERGDINASIEPAWSKAALASLMAKWMRTNWGKEAAPSTNKKHSVSALTRWREQKLKAE